MNWYKRYPGDYARDTQNLTLLQHGAYTLLLDHAYATERPIATLEDAYQICKAAFPAHKKCVQQVLAQFFFKTSLGYINQRVQIEISLALSKKDSARRSANARWTQCERNANASKTQCSPDSRLQKLNSAVIDGGAGDRSSNNTPENGTAAAAANLPVSVDEIADAFRALNSRPLGEYSFQLLYTLATRNYSGSFTDVMEAAIVAAKNKGVTVPREFYALKREVEEIEVKNSFKQPPL